MRRGLQIVALALVWVLLLGPLTQADSSCRSLRGRGQCSNCPMPYPASNCDSVGQASAPCCQISAARTSPDLAWQPVVTYALAPPAGTASPVLFAPAPVVIAGHAFRPPAAPAQDLLCTFLI